METNERFGEGPKPGDMMTRPQDVNHVNLQGLRQQHYQEEVPRPGFDKAQGGVLAGESASTARGMEGAASADNLRKLTQPDTEGRFP